MIHPVRAAHRAVDRNGSLWDRLATSYEGSDRFTDPGERAVLHEVATQVRGGPLLDIGVGAGRSTWFLGLMSDDYLGVDSSAAMVELAQQAHPTRRFAVMDARHLDLPDRSVAFVFFSHAGLDSLDHEGRQEALAEMARVVRADGVVAYSTLNRGGHFYRCGPGPVGHGGRRPGAVQYLRFGARATLHPGSHYRGFVNTHRMRSQFRDHGDWALDTMPTHDWSLLVHYVTLAEAVREAHQAGLETERLVAREGQVLSPDGSTTTPWFHVLARPAHG